MKNTFRFFCGLYLSVVFVAIISWKVFGDRTGITSNPLNILLSPSTEYIFGTDALGRDLFLRVLEGGFYSLAVVFFSSVLSLAVAIIVGVLTTWYFPRNPWTLLVMDLAQALPSYVISTLIFLLIQSRLQSSLGTLVGLIAALSLTHWVNPARIFRTQTVLLLGAPFVEASRALGATPWYILFRHLPGHIKSTFFILWALQLPVLLMYESFMSFIGFGIEAPSTSWGFLLQEGWKYLGQYPHLLLMPGLALFTVLICINYLIDPIRQVEGPHFSRSLLKH